MSDYLPSGCNENDPNAPWNQGQWPKTININVTLVLNKTIEVEVDDYIDNGKDGIDYSECDLEKAIKERMYLPCDKSKDITLLDPIKYDLMDWESIEEVYILDE